MPCRNKLTPEKALFDIFQSLKIEQYKKTVLQQRYLEILRNFHFRAVYLGYFFYISRVIVTVGSILVPAFLSIQNSTGSSQIYWATWIISLSVTISNGFMTLFKLDKKYFFINTTLEMLYSEGWQYAGLSGRYSGKDTTIPVTHENQFLIFFHMAEKIKMRQVEEEYWKFTDTSGVGNATNQKMPLVSQTPNVNLPSVPEEQKSVLERWVGDMNPRMLGLQPRSGNLSRRVDGGKASRIPESPSETDVSMLKTLSKGASSREIILQGSRAEERIPENTIIKVVLEEPDNWLGTGEKLRSLEQESDSEGQP